MEFEMIGFELRTEERKGGILLNGFESAEVSMFGDRWKDHRRWWTAG